MKTIFNRTFVYITIFISACIVLACSNDRQQSSQRYKARIVVTTNIMADVVRNIVKDSMEVTSIMGPGVDPHLYKATQKDFTLFKEADIIFYNGLHLEGKLSEALNKLSQQKPCYALGDALPKEQLIQVGSSTYDPHIWFDPLLMKIIVAEVASKLSVHYPTMAAYFKQNAASYKEAIDSVHAMIKEKFKEVPTERKILVTAHDAFEYYGRRYEIQVKGLQGISTISEAGLYDVAALVSFIIGNDVKAIFAETTVSPKALQSVVESCQNKGHKVKLVPGLYSDSLGDASSPASTYLKMLVFNTTLIVDNIK
ncbi:manganese/zinc/iron transport system substrate-binding protein [Thermonema lapsum]|uniref:Manganese/zinc/iron transport system substrate-binding protein n=1 Tax=Thermonema lapsum TaxID=28195 RepID=A0A846MN50_9BACT|nr:zinc ABC transporter substrate-binding protein [Thermonema lapsum]NIK72875.1 manganese/zinc/iron transport system substrate-binding protein [Thermonema lapsum]